jgi:hypothetical protein
MGKNQDPGSGINIPDPPHCLILDILSFFSDGKSKKKLKVKNHFNVIKPGRGVAQ